MTQRYEGKLELTWTNKHLRLLAHEDGSYEWVEPADYRVAEVRLLDDVDTVGTTRAARFRAKDNLLIRGDALNALTSLAELPEFAAEYLGKVRLAYIDPPFNTQQSWLNYDDALEHSVWLTMVRDRLQQIKRLLHPETGSVWVHCDDYEMARLKVMMDEVFGPDNFIATVVWQRQASQSNMAVFSTSHDYIVVYARDRAGFGRTRNRMPRTQKQAAMYSNPDNDSRGPWTSQPVQARNFYSKGSYAITTPSGRVIDGPPAGRFWSVSEEKLAELDADGRIWWGPNGDGVPRIKGFESEAQDLVPKTWWPYQEVGTTDEAKRESKALNPDGAPFATPKPERLMRRVIEIASGPNDIVLDCFAGSGTTAAVAHKLGRRWVGIEQSTKTVDTFTEPRLAAIVRGDDPGGITGDVGWEGGGGFHILQTAPSMFDAVEGRVYLANWATNGKLQEATAAQLGFVYEPDGPFVGRKNRSRLAVIDGLVDEAAVRLLLEELPEDERLVACGTAYDPTVQPMLRQLRPGSRVRKIPATLLAEYRQTDRFALPTVTAQAEDNSVPTAPTPEPVASP